MKHLRNDSSPFGAVTIYIHFIYITNIVISISMIRHGRYARNYVHSLRLDVWGFKTDRFVLLSCVTMVAPWHRGADGIHRGMRLIPSIQWRTSGKCG